MKIIGIILIVLQVVGLVSAAANGMLAGLLSSSIGYLIGFFAPAIIGIFLLIKASKK